MYLNVSDGLYSVNVEGLDWTPQTVSLKHRGRGTCTPQKTRKRKKFIVAPTSTRVSKRKRKETKTPTNRRILPAEQPESESESENGLFVTENEASNEGEETEDDMGFGRLPPSGRFSPEGQVMQSEKAMKVVKTVERSDVTDESGKRSRNGKGKGNGKTPEMESNNSDPWWELIQVPESNARDENVHFSLIGRRRSGFSLEAIEAADILLMMAQDSRGVLGCRHKSTG